VNARNAGIEALMDTGADWMATFDDDEAISGPQIRVLPEGHSKWLKAPTKPNPETGMRVWNASTGNALFHR